MRAQVNLDMYLIVGLGNPGRQYAKTRHNTGFLLINHLSSGHGIKLDHRECLSRTGSGSIGGRLAILARPSTYMNLSGEALARLVKKYRIQPSRLVVAHDDLDLKPGQIRLRTGGSSAGHKGIQSVIERLGSRDFIRLKIGIGRPAAKSSEDEIIDYVLGEFDPGQAVLIESALPRAADAVECLLNEGLEAAMNRFNRSFAPDSGG